MTGPERQEIAEAHFRRLADTARAAAEPMAAAAAEVAEEVLAVLRGGGKLLFCGNGGSAADAQHLAAEYVVRFRRERRGLPALALTVDTSVLTAGGNDYGFETVFARQVEALARPGDLLFLHSTSGNSENLIRAAEQARGQGVRTVALLARDGGKLRPRVDRAVVVPTDTTATAQELHLAFGHAVCDLVDRGWTTEEDPPGLSADWIETIEEARDAEKEQTLFYRALAARAVEEGRGADEERWNELHADEQHHLSRLTAQLLESGVAPSDLSTRAAPTVPAVEDEEGVAREREGAEVERYRRLLGEGPPPDLRAILEEIVEAEEAHRDHLRGKWMSA